MVYIPRPTINDGIDTVTKKKELEEIRKKENNFLLIINKTKKWRHLKFIRRGGRDTMTSIT